MMTLHELCNDGRLTTHEPILAEIQDLLEAADANLRDASVDSVGNATRFHGVYKAVVRCALASVLAAGYKPVPMQDHHQTVLLCLRETLDVGRDGWGFYEVMRRLSNENYYTGSPIPDEMLLEGIRRASALRDTLVVQLAAQFPQVQWTKPGGATCCEVR